MKIFKIDSVTPDDIEESFYIGISKDLKKNYKHGPVNDFAKNEYYGILTP